MDLTSLGGAKSLSFDYASSDVGQFGINTPLYFAMDNLTLSVVPEPSSALLAGIAVAIIALPAALRCRLRGPVRLR
jgi:hypothetical protein